MLLTNMMIFLSKQLSVFCFMSEFYIHGLRVLRYHLRIFYYANLVYLLFKFGVCLFFDVLKLLLERLPKNCPRSLKTGTIKKNRLILRTLKNCFIIYLYVLWYSLTNVSVKVLIYLYTKVYLYNIWLNLQSKVCLPTKMFFFSLLFLINI